MGGNVKLLMANKDFFLQKEKIVDPKIVRVKDLAYAPMGSGNSVSVRVRAGL